MDDPEIPEDKPWGIDFFATYAHTDGEDVATIPAVEVDYTLIPNVQLHAVGSLRYDHVPGGAPDWGLGDTELGVKYRFVQETDLCPQIAIFPLVELGTGDSERGLGNRKTEYFVPVWLMKNFGPDKQWTTFGGGGFWYHPGTGDRNFFRFGWEVERKITEWFSLGVEVYHETTQTRTDPGHTAFNIGTYLNLNENNLILISAGRDIDGPNEFACYLGYQILF